MIIDPDFLDHWRTGMVVDALGDPMAPIYIMRLWAHCQERKSDTFVMPTRGLKAQCKCPADAEVFEAALIEAGFIKRDGETVYVTGWAEKNASLIAAWENGAKGGRPKKEPIQNPDVTQEEPKANPEITQQEPTGNPAVTDKRREEKIREEKKETGERRASRLPAHWKPDDDLRKWGAEARPDLDLDDVCEKFRDYWHSKPGAAGRKLDWAATFRNWVREERGRPAARASPGAQLKSFAEQDREAGMLKWELMTGQIHPDRLPQTTVIDITPLSFLELPK